MQKKIIVIVGIIIAVAALSIFVMVKVLDNNKIKSINSYAECVAAGYPIQESYPEQCRTPDGRSFTNTAVPTIGMANPASVNCIDKGGTLEIREEALGQVGYCTLKSGKVCEEWKFFRGECN